MELAQRMIHVQRCASCVTSLVQSHTHAVSGVVLLTAAWQGIYAYAEAYAYICGSIRIEVLVWCWPHAAVLDLLLYLLALLSALLAAPYFTNTRE